MKITFELEEMERMKLNSELDGNEIQNQLIEWREHCFYLGINGYELCVRMS